jgi:hypothetical protein
MKGTGSYSDALEQIIEKYDAVTEPSKVPATAATNPHNTGEGHD